MKVPVKERFMRHVEQIPETGCWLWTAALFSGTGYGSFKEDGKVHYAHRMAYELFKGHIPEDQWVLHTCDVKCCVNPNHLYIGTHADNTRDAHQRRRFAYGTKNWRRTCDPLLISGENNVRSKLTESQVREILASKEPNAVMARRFGVSKTNIGDIVNRKTWRHIQ